MNHLLCCESPVQIREDVLDCLTLYLEYLFLPETFFNLQWIWLSIDMFSGHCCLAYTLWKRTSDTSAEEYNSPELILFLVTVRRPVLICPVCMTSESRILLVFHGEIRDDFYFCFTAGGLTALILQRFVLCAELHIKPFGETTKPKSEIFLRCKETKKFILDLWVKTSCS